MGAALDVAGIRDALADLLRTSSASDVEVIPRWDGASVPSRIPCLMLQVDGIAYHQAMASGMAELRMRVTAYVPFTEDGELLLDRMMSSGSAARGDSIIDAIEVDRRTAGGTGLGGMVHEAAVLEALPARRAVVFDANDGSRAWACDWTVSLYQPHKRSS